jgi:hypothetical protein
MPLNVDNKDLYDIISDRLKDLKSIMEVNHAEALSNVIAAVTSVADAKEQLIKVSDKLIKLEGAVESGHGRLDSIIEHQGVANGRLSKAEDAIVKVNEAVCKEQWLTEGAKQAKEDINNKNRWMWGAFWASSGVITAIIFNILRVINIF